MSDKERVINEIWYRLQSGGVEQRQLAAAEIYDAGYAAALERAAEIARAEKEYWRQPQGLIHSEKRADVADDIAAAIEREKSLPR